MKASLVKIKPWSDEQTPTEALVRDMLHAEGLRPYRWSNGPGDVYGAHSHPYHKVLYVVEGSITFGFPEKGEPAVLYPGDRLELPPGLPHNAIVGPRGVVCLEAHRT